MGMLRRAGGALAWPVAVLAACGEDDTYNVDDAQDVTIEAAERKYFERGTTLNNAIRQALKALVAREIDADAVSDTIGRDFDQFSCFVAGLDAAGEEAEG